MIALLKCLGWAAGLVFTVGVITACAWWQAHRGDRAMGIADTQGREDFSTEANEEHGEEPNA